MESEMIDRPEMTWKLVSQIDGALADRPGVTSEQLVEVRRLRGEVIEHCADGAFDKATTSAERALSLIEEGSALKEI